MADGETQTAPEHEQEVVEHREESPRQAVEHPAELLRLAHMIQSTLTEVRSIDLDEAGRDRLADVYNRTISQLRGAISEDLQDELDDIAVGELPDEPTSGELRIAQAQLVGWLQGLFQGIQASMASQQLQAAQQQQQAAQRPGGGQQGGPAPGGQYL